MNLFLTLVIGAAAQAGAWDSRLELGVDLKLELVGASETAAGVSSRGFAASKDEYGKQALRRLASTSAPLAALLQAFPKGFDFAQRCDVVDRLGPLLEPTTRYFIPEGAVAQAGGRAAVDAWLESLGRLRRQSDFDRFFLVWKPALESRLEPLRSAIARADAIAAVEEYTGLPFEGRYVMLATPYLDSERMLNSVWPLADGSFELRTLLSLDAKPRHADYFWRERLPVTVWHQAAHGLLDTLAELSRQEIEARAAAQPATPAAPWAEEGVQNVKEHIVRAVYIRLLALRVGEQAARRAWHSDDESSFPAVPALIEKLKMYEAERARYKTLAAFYPRLLEAFPLRGRALPPFDGSPDKRARGFRTPGQLRRALRYAELVRQGGDDARLAAIKGALEQALKDAGG